MRRWAGSLLIGLLVVMTVRAEVKFPSLGEVQASKLNVRAGPNRNYEVLTRVSRGKKIIILGEYGDWYKILLPEGVGVWIYGEYVKRTGRKGEFAGVKVEGGELTANNVRIRAKPDLKGTVLGKVSVGERVLVMGSKGEWLQILAPFECNGWVHKCYVKLVGGADKVIRERQKAYEKFVEKLFEEKKGESTPPPEPPKVPESTQDAAKESVAWRVFESLKAKYGEFDREKVDDNIRVWKEFCQKFAGTEAEREARKIVNDLTRLRQACEELERLKEEEASLPYKRGRKLEDAVSNLVIEYEDFINEYYDTPFVQEAAERLKKLREFYKGHLPDRILWGNRGFVERRERHGQKD